MRSDRRWDDGNRSARTVVGPESEPESGPNDRQHDGGAPQDATSNPTPGRTIRVGGLVVGLTVLAALTVALTQTSYLPGDRAAAHAWGRPRSDSWQPALTSVVHVLSPIHCAAVLVGVAVLSCAIRRTPRPVLFAVTALVLLSVTLLAWKTATWRGGPQGRTANRIGGSFPSAHISFFLTCGWTAFVIVRVRARWSPPVLAAAAVAFGYVLIRLRDHWLSDVVGAVALSVVVLTCASIVFPSEAGTIRGRSREQRPPRPMRRSGRSGGGSSEPAG